MESKNFISGRDSVLSDLKKCNPDVKFGGVNVDNGKVLVDCHLRQLNIPVGCKIDMRCGCVYKGGHPSKDPLSECVDLETRISEKVLDRQR
ncbi:MAG: hypothetical protein PHX09_04050 [Clostridia bacterium]|nr:hypothetical protein [Clostridia bacterium]